MIETLIIALTAVGFGLGVTFTVLGFLLLHQIFIAGKRFNSWMLMVQLSMLLSSLGLTFLWLVFT